MAAWYDFERAFQNGVDKVCSVCSSKDIVEPSAHAESFNVKQRLTSEKSRKLPNEILPIFLMYFRKSDLFGQDAIVY